MDGRSLDYSKMTIQEGDKVVVPFSYSTDPADVQIEQVPCFLTYTNEETHTIIRQNIDRSPIYAGIIEGTGPRYCPSIEDKVVKFAEKTRHQVFIEPEGRGTNEVYVDGMSSSMPDDVQQRMYRTVPGLENCVIVKNAYAIEYDCINANLLKLTLETRDVDGLFCAGQFNGSSGYEEAAAQGLMAGINASMKILGKEPLVLKRSEAYIGVLIDDLVTKDNREPYRMMTSRAEYRLLLRQDNADLRLRKYGYRVGLISQEQYDHVCAKEKMISDEIARLKSIRIGAARENQEYLRAHNSADLKTACSLAELMCRPELGLILLTLRQPALLQSLCADRNSAMSRWRVLILTENRFPRKLQSRSRSISAMRDISPDKRGRLSSSTRWKTEKFLQTSIITMSEASVWKPGRNSKNSDLPQSDRLPACRELHPPISLCC